MSRFRLSATAHGRGAGSSDGVFRGGLLRVYMAGSPVSCWHWRAQVAPTSRRGNWTPARTARSRMKRRESGAGVQTRARAARRAVRLPDRIAVNGHRGGTQTAGPDEAVADRTDAPEGLGMIRAERFRPVWTPRVEGRICAGSGWARTVRKALRVQGGLRRLAGPPAEYKSRVPMGRAACNRPRSPANKQDSCMGFPP